jgi:S-adenosylmethionine:tRNA ribosyltransferase-isomerase
MRRADFHYDLPPELIAQEPPAERGSSRLLVVDDGWHDRRFSDLIEYLDAGDLAVFNDTRVIPARVYARKHSGGRVELLLERLLGGRRALVQARASKGLNAGTQLMLDDGRALQVIERRETFCEVEFPDDALAYLEAAGQVPLPPYIERAPTSADRERYQTIFARSPGAVAAPTAGLHFDQPLLDHLADKDVEAAYLTLHVGAGTFQPVRVDDLETHRLHPERVTVSAPLCAQIAATRSRGGRVVAIGTTVVRALESAAAGGEPAPFDGDTRLFITPGYEFRVVDALLTNFHLPESTLLMLVAAFAGYDAVMAAYRHAVTERYRFFSYGDAMLLPRRALGAR